MIPILDDGRLVMRRPGERCPVCQARFNSVRAWPVRHGRVQRGGYGLGTTITCPCCQPTAGLLRLLDGGPL